MTFCLRSMNRGKILKFTTQQRIPTFFSVQFLQDPCLDSEDDERKRVDKASRWLASRLSTYLKVKGPVQWLFVRHKFFFIVLLTKIANLSVVVLVLFATENVSTQYLSQLYSYLKHFLNNNLNQFYHDRFYTSDLIYMHFFLAYGRDLHFNSVYDCSQQP